MAVTADRYIDPATGRFVMLTCNVQPAEDIRGFVSECPVLGVTSQGGTLDEAESNIRDAVCLYLTTMDEVGELERIFAEGGLKVAIAPEYLVQTGDVPTVDGGRVFA
ncbi:MAG: type II toxin-antitoxin system HicB family antitoxin [Chloroflexota bacterium]